DDGRLAALLSDARRHRLARFLLAARHHHLGAQGGEALDDGAADALARPGDHRDLAGEIEWIGHAIPPPLPLPVGWAKRAEQSEARVPTNGGHGRFADATRP